MAQAIHVSGCEVAKTVLLRADDGMTYVVAVLPADKHIDLAEASKVVGDEQLHLATEVEIACHCPDCEVGALPPFGSHYGMKTLLDSCLLGQDEVVFEGNTHHESVRMSVEDFQRIEEPLTGSFTH